MKGLSQMPTPGLCGTHAVDDPIAGLRLYRMLAVAFASSVPAY